MNLVEAGKADMVFRLIPVALPPAIGAPMQWHRALIRVCKRFAAEITTPCAPNCHNVHLQGNCRARATPSFRLGTSRPPGSVATSRFLCMRLAVAQLLQTSSTRRIAHFVCAVVIIPEHIYLAISPDESSAAIAVYALHRFFPLR